MLSIEASKNADAAHKYFRDHLLAGDYYTEKKSIPGYWHGKTAKMLGLEGEVKARDFEALLFNVDPRSGDRLTARNVSNRRPMYDATFSAPKSVSILYSILQDQDVLIAHRTAVQKAMAAMESDIQTQTGNGKAKRYETTGNLVYAEFVHETSRPLKQKDNKQYIPDPQLHSHATVINATWFEKEGRFRAVEMGTVKGQSSYYESLYHSFLGHEMRKLGFELEKEGKRWEVKNIDKTIRDKFSGRTLEIEAIAEKRGIKSAKAKAQLGRLTRHSKDKSVDDRELPEIWKGRLTESEYQKILTAKGAYYSDDKGKGDKGSPMNAERALDLAFEHVFERQSAIQEKRLLAHAIDLASGQVLPETIHEELKSRKNIIAANRNGVKYVSTREMLREEERMIERASLGKATCPQLNPGYEFKNDLLNDGQKAAIKHVLESRDRIIIVSGDAGVGKTTLMQRVRQGIEDSGKRLFAFAPTAEASRVQLQGKGFEEADTISRLLANPELQAKLKNQVILIDEAGLVSVRAMNQLMDIVDQTGSRMILSGDYKQHSSVEAGDAQRLLEHQAGLPVARVNEIIRQRANEPYKRVIENVANGIGIKNDPEKRKFEIAQAYDRLDESGHIIAVPDIAERHKLIANEYLESSKKSPKDVIVVSPTHGEGREITKAIRERLKEEGRIGLEDREFERLVNTHLSGSEKQINTNYSPGQIVEFHQNVKGFRAGSRFEVAGRNEQGNVLVKAENQVAPVALPMDQFQNFQVFNKETINFTKQDQLKITKNSKSIEGSNLFNGQTYEIRGFSDEGHIKLSNGQTLDRKSMHFDTSYYQTSYSAQGRDAKTVLVAQSSKSLAASNDKQFYVTISRGTENLKIYTDDKDSLREAVSRSGDRISAGEIAKQAQVARPDKAKEAEYMSNIRLFYDQKIKPAFERIKSDYERGTPNRQMERPGRSLEA